MILTSCNNDFCFSTAKGKHLTTGRRACTCSPPVKVQRILSLFIPSHLNKSEAKISTTWLDVKMFDSCIIRSDRRIPSVCKTNLDHYKVIEDLTTNEKYNQIITTSGLERSEKNDIFVQNHVFLVKKNPGETPGHHNTILPERINISKLKDSG